MEKPSFSVWAMLVLALLVVLLCAGGVYLSSTRSTGGTVVFALAEREIVQMDVLETPAPTPEPLLLPEGAVDVLVDRTRVALTLTSAAEAEQVLTDYLYWCMETVPEAGERGMSASFGAEVHIIPAGGKTPLTSAEGAAAKLRADASLVPAVVTAQQRSITVGETATEKHSDAALGKDLRMYTQIGQGERTLTTTNVTYLAGERASTATPQTEILAPGRATIVRVGTYRSEKPADAPGKQEGPAGKSADGLVLTLPVKAAISSYFGTRGGVMHNGVDVAGKAGAPVYAPGEGVVIYVGARSEYGTVIDIDHGNGFVSRLTHCENVTVERNQRVFPDEQVATLAALTYGTGKPHVHYELLIDGVPYNPVRYLG